MLTDVFRSYISPSLKINLRKGVKLSIHKLIKLKLWIVRHQLELILWRN